MNEFEHGREYGECFLDGGGCPFDAGSYSRRFGLNGDTLNGFAGVIAYASICKRKGCDCPLSLDVDARETSERLSSTLG